MKPEDLRAFARRDWAAAATAEREAWRLRRDRLGPADGLRLTAQLGSAIRALRPDWPSTAEREADLEMHVRLGQALRRVE